MNKDCNDILYNIYKDRNDMYNNNDKGNNYIWGSKCMGRHNNIYNIYKGKLNI
jgi:hypothetical protein